jgi:hypothetical protein
MTHPSCIRTQPRPVPDASQKTSKGLELSGCSSTGAEVKCCLKVWKAFSHALLHTNFTPFLSSSVIGFVILEKSRMNRRLYPANPKKLRIWCTDLGGFQSITSWTLLGSTEIPSWEIVCPKNFTLFNHNSHLENLA